LPHLTKLNQKGWWTVGSQPAVDGARSDDPAVGFGPAGGWVYQKAFVEFFAPPEDVERLAARLGNGAEGEGLVCKFFAGNKKGEWKTNMEKGDSNAVTWGVFQGRGVVTTTMIEEMSFTAWKVRRRRSASSVTPLTLCSNCLR